MGNGDKSDTEQKPRVIRFLDVPRETRLEVGDVVTKIPVARLNAKEDFQGRIKTKPSAVKDYASQYQRGSDGPPLKVAYFAGLFFVIDGFHRREALVKAGCDLAPAVEIVATNRRGAFAEASKANIDHGVPLTGAAYKNLLDLYLKGGRHIRWTGKHGGVVFKTFEEIAADFNFIRSASTYRRWIMKHHPKVYRQMGSDDKPFSKAGGHTYGPSWDDPGAVLKDLILQAAAVAEKLEPNRLYIHLAEGLVKKLKGDQEQFSYMLDGSEDF